MIQRHDVAATEQDTQVATQERGGTTRRRSEQRTLVPPIDAYETDDAIVILADMPGVDQSGVDLTIDRGVLTVRGHSSQHVPEGFSPVYQEFAPGDFQRSITLSDQVDPDQVKASIEMGVLRIELPKRDQAKPRRIPVKPS